MGRSLPSASIRGSIRVLKVATRPATQRVPAGSFYVSLAQPLAPLISAALEPDSQNSYAANRLLAIEAGQLRRVMQAPPAGAALQPAH